MNYTMGTIDWTTAKKLVTTNTWHAHLVQTVYEHNKKGRKIEIIEDTTRLSLLRISGEFLMRAFIESDIPKSDLNIINIMQMSIKAISLADITTTDGLSITSNAWKLLSSKGIHDKLVWPRKPPQFTTQQIHTW